MKRCLFAVSAAIATCIAGNVLADENRLNAPSQEGSESAVIWCAGDVRGDSHAACCPGRWNVRTVRGARDK